MISIFQRTPARDGRDPQVPPALVQSAAVRQTLTPAAAIVQQTPTLAVGVIDGACKGANVECYARRMGDAARRLIDEALALPEDEREVIAVELMASLGERDDDWEDAWSVEIDRRVAEIRSGDVALRPWSEVRADLLRQK